MSLRNTEDNTVIQLTKPYLIATLFDIQKNWIINQTL